MIPSHPKLRAHPTGKAMHPAHAEDEPPPLFTCPSHAPCLSIPHTLLSATPSTPAGAPGCARPGHDTAAEPRRRRWGQLLQRALQRRLAAAGVQLLVLADGGRDHGAVAEEKRVMTYLIMEQWLKKQV